MGIQIALVGAGGKTTAMGLLARQSQLQSVLITTTTHIFPIVPPVSRICLADPSPEALANALQIPGIVCAGAAAPHGKLQRLPAETLSQGLASAGLTVYEADGSRRLPLKLHKAEEPVLLPQTDHCLILAGLSALGQPVEVVVHRYGLAPEWQKHPQKSVGVPELIKCVLETAEAAALPRSALRVFLNQADTLEDPAPAIEAARQLNALGLKTRWGSLHRAPEDLYAWVTSD